MDIFVGFLLAIVMIPFGLVVTVLSIALTIISMVIRLGWFIISLPFVALYNLFGGNRAYVY